MQATLPRLDVANADFVTPTLAIGGDLDPTLFRALDQLEELADAGITHILDVRIEGSDSEFVARHHPEIAYLHHGVDDAGQRIPGAWFEEGVRWVNSAVDGGGAVLVHCHMGVNRGPSLGYAVLLAQGRDLIEALDAIRGARPVAALAYAADALEWHHRRTGGTTTALRRDLRRLAAWRRANDVELANVVRQVMRDERQVPTWAVLRRHPGAVMILFSEAGALDRPIDRDYEWFDTPSNRVTYFNEMVEWAKDWVADWDGFAVTLVNIADTEAMAIDDIVLVAPNTPERARCEWIDVLRSSPALAADRDTDDLTEASIGEHVISHEPYDSHISDRLGEEGISMKYWLYKNNRAEGGPAGFWGDWYDGVFSQNESVEWGGHYSTLSPEVAIRLNEDVAAGDVVVAYQTDDKAVVGFARIAKITGGPDSRKLYLKPLHFLAQPFEIHKHKKGTVLENSAAVNGPVMMRELTKEEMATLVDLAGAPRSVLQGK